MSACRHGDLDAVKACLASGAQLNTAHAHEHGIVLTPLAIAAAYERKAVVLHLLSIGADPNGRDVMERGVANGTPDILQLLVDAGGDVNRKDGGRPLPIFTAAASNAGDVVGKLRVLLALPAVNLAVTNAGKSPVEHATVRSKPVLAAMIRDVVGSWFWGEASLCEARCVRVLVGGGLY